MVHTAGIVSYSTIAKGDVDNFDKIIGWVVISDSGVNKDLAQTFRREESMRVPGNEGLAGNIV